MKDNLVEIQLKDCHTALLYEANDIYDLGMHKPKSLLTVIFNTSACFCGAIALVVWAFNGNYTLWGSFLTLAVIFYGLYKDFKHYMIDSYKMLSRFLNQIEDNALYYNGDHLYVGDERLKGVFYSIKKADETKLLGYISPISGCYRFKLSVRK